jgi:hypothetical protein
MKSIVFLTPDTKYLGISSNTTIPTLQNTNRWPTVQFDSDPTSQVLRAKYHKSALALDT